MLLFKLGCYTQLHESAHSKQSPLPVRWDQPVLAHSRKFFYTNWLGHPSGHIWYRTKLPDRVHQVRRRQLRIFLPCHTGKTRAGQVHGSTTLCVPAPLDAEEYRSTFHARRPPQVLRVRQGSNRSRCHNSSS